MAERYRLLRPLGVGGSSVVWEARDERDADGAPPVALKLAREGASPARIRREVALLRRLRMPGVVSMLDDGIDRGRYFLVMEQVRGAPYPGTAAPRGWAELQATTLALLAVLDLIHREGVVHRDLKPANVLVDASGRPVILDFGIACEVSSRAASLAPYDRTAGSAPYMAPEQRAGALAFPGPETDLYAVGVMVREALRGAEAPARVLALLDAMTGSDPKARPASARDVVARLRGSSRAVTVARDAAGEETLSPARLRELFTGDDRLLHLREDAARVLDAHTGGGSTRVRSTLEWWVFTGHARPEGGGYAIAREALDWLESTDPIQGEFEVTAGGVDDRELELLRWVSLAWPHGTAERLAGWSGAAEAEVARAVDDLVRRGHVWRREDGALGLTRGRAVHLDWDTDRRCAALRRVVDTLPAGTPGRFAHLQRLEGEDDPAAFRREAVEAALQEAAAHFDGGALGRAGEVLLDALMLLEAADLDEVLALARRLFCMLARVVLSGVSPRAKDRLLAELARWEARDPELAQIAALVRADLDVLRWGSRALEAARALPPFDDPALETRRQAVRVAASRRVSLDCNAAEVAALARWAGRTGTAAARAALPGWAGMLRYAQRRYEDAARCHELAARRAGHAVDAIRESLNAASAWLEAFEVARAEALAETARRRAEAARLAFLEGRAEWVLRSVAYRRGEALAHDRELLESARRVHPELEAMLALVDAAFAYRAGERGLCRALAARGRRIYEQARRPLIPMLFRGLEVAAGGDASAAEIAALSRLALGPEARALPRIVLQTLALFALGRGAAPVGGEALRDLVESVPAEHRSRRLEALSVDECIAALQPVGEGQMLAGRAFTRVMTDDS